MAVAGHGSRTQLRSAAAHPPIGWVGLPQFVALPVNTQGAAEAHGPAQHEGHDRTGMAPHMAPVTQRHRCRGGASPTTTGRPRLPGWTVQWSNRHWCLVRRRPSRPHRYPGGPSGQRAGAPTPHHSRLSPVEWPRRAPAGALPRPSPHQVDRAGQGCARGVHVNLG